MRIQFMPCLLSGTGLVRDRDLALDQNAGDVRLRREALLLDDGVDQLGIQDSVPVRVRDRAGVRRPPAILDYFPYSVRQREHLSAVCDDERSLVRQRAAG